jgi:hypothetical protein
MRYPERVSHLPESSLQFHHFFAFVPEGAPQVDALIRAGFVEGSRNRHPGQGTANRRIFFENGMLEFIWAETETEAEIRSAVTAPTRLWERSQWRASGFSPFGICVCPSAEASRQEVAPAEPFDGWAYRPPYLPPGMRIWNATQDDRPWEPMIFYFPALKPIHPGAPVLSRSGAKEPIEHLNGARRIERVTVTMRQPGNGAEGLSSAASRLGSVAGITLELGQAAQAEIRVSGGGAEVAGLDLDLGPGCPVRVIGQIHS